MTNPVTHFEIMGKDSVALQKFYADVFGWKLAPPIKEMGNYSLFDNEGKGIGGGIGEGDARVTVYIEVDDPQAYLDKAVEAGAKMLMEVSQIAPDTTIALFADPQGNMTGLFKATPQ
jgi:predicted enzyme related to lactoylglutathione lyase